MGQRRSGGRTGGGNFSGTGYYSSNKKRSSNHSNQSLQSGSQRYSSPTRRPYSQPRRVSWSSESSNGSSLLGGRDMNRSSPPPYHSDAQKLIIWNNIRNSSSGLNNGNESESGVSSNGSQCEGHKKKSDRPTAARPSNPLRYKTELCRSHDEGGVCKFGNTCTFAHGLVELRAVPRHPRYKTDPCRTYHSLGYCQYGARCHFVHDPEEAAGVSPMRGHKLHLRQDRLSAALLAMAKTAGISPDPVNNDALLGNLLGLQAVRSLRDQKMKPETIEVGGTTIGTGANISISFDSGLLGGIDVTLSDSDLGKSDSVLGSSKFEMTPCQMKNYDMDKCNNDVTVNSSFDTVPSVSPPAGLWWEGWSNMLTPPVSPDAQKPQLIPQSFLDDWRPLEPAAKSVTAARKLFSFSQKPFPSLMEIKEAMDSVTSPRIVNPMDMSRNLRLPSIVDLH
ncbi:hypothetical protein Pmani_017355 [Petrolisthes manimaculis]|uniref:C3H1-type domain-containing protein n=1 Tax=Petrolisthes manimaculis TaxID=1843537 RepID=A0AAE1PQA3_9EUCA|nr:hypothetical protein Pmani_017355 [Petrolisthes manimaculis]